MRKRLFLLSFALANLSYNGVQYAVTAQSETRPAVLSGEDMMRILPGNTLLAFDESGPFWMYFPEPGTVWGQSSSGDVDVGRWWVEDDRYCRSWRLWYDGATQCWTLATYGDNRIFWMDSQHAVQGESQVSQGNAIGSIPPPLLASTTTDIEIGPITVSGTIGPEPRLFLKAGADLVITSMQKAFAGLTAATVAGRLDLVRACYFQDKGIGRPMKVGKEGVIATIAALERWEHLDHAQVRADRHAFRALIVDPVMVATTGALLLEKDAVEAIRKWLLPRATLVTPNAPEAATLLGWTIRESSQLPSAARVLVEDMDVRAVLVKGGDLPGAELLDVFYDGERIELFRSSRIETTSTHGSGCALSSAIAAHVARGSEILDAVRKAREWVRRGIREAPPLGRGRGPLDLFG